MSWRKAALAAAVIASAVASAGCAAVGGGGGPGVAAPAELGRARAELSMAWASPDAPLAIEELQEASRALEVAEQEARARPGSREARDAAYVAERKAERARIATLVEVNRQALHKARRLHAQAQRTAESRRGAQGSGNEVSAAQR